MILEKIKELRNKTFLSIQLCKEALENSEFNMENAILYLREKGKLKADGFSSREIKAGQIFQYLHHNKQLGIMIKIGCETDFVANCDVFKELGKNLCLHIAANSPQYLNQEEIPKTIMDNELKLIEASIPTKAPDNKKDQIKKGKLESYYKQVCLLDQPYLFDTKLSVTDVIKNVMAQTGENIVIVEFSRMNIN
jgi:elongation factor Ts